jgi:hypothetical protein
MTATITCTGGRNVTGSAMPDRGLPREPAGDAPP